MRNVIIHSDGSSKIINGVRVGGCAALVECDGHKMAVVDGILDATNNQMELQGVIACLNTLTEPCKITAVTDSKYVVNSINSWIKNWKRNGWKTCDGRSVSNQPQLKELADHMATHKIKAKWVKGHAGHAENELCDELADLATSRVFDRFVKTT
jgi:ribonuclease HI